MQPFSNEYIDDIRPNIDTNYFTPILNEVADIAQFKRVLDVGCGNGLFTVALKKRQKNIHISGVDANEYALEIAKENGFDDVRYITDFDSCSLPYPNDTFDLIICKDVIEHLVSPNILLRELSRVLNRNGSLLLHVPNQFCLYGRIKFLFTNNIDTFDYFPESATYNYPHIRFFSHKDLIALASDAEFVPKLDLSFHFFCLPLMRYIPLRDWLAQYLVKLAPSQFSQGFTILFRKRQSAEI
jgi:2-polyprenyl-3-methyl-5-hydroxy-6-metoxy-1,4-benzoquinol methylase